MSLRVAAWCLALASLVGCHSSAKREVRAQTKAPTTERRALPPSACEQAHDETPDEAVVRGELASLSQRIATEWRAPLDSPQAFGPEVVDAIAQIDAREKTRSTLWTALERLLPRGARHTPAILIEQGGLDHTFFRALLRTAPLLGTPAERQRIVKLQADVEQIIDDPASSPEDQTRGQKMLEEIDAIRVRIHTWHGKRLPLVEALQSEAVDRYARAVLECRLVGTHDLASVRHAWVMLGYLEETMGSLRMSLSLLRVQREYDFFEYEVNTFAQSFDTWNTPVRRPSH